MGIREDCNLLDRISKSIVNNFYCRPYKYSKVTQNVIKSLFVPLHDTNGVFKLSKNDIKIVIDILELIED
jgi:hypothetical protein